MVVSQEVTTVWDAWWRTRMKIESRRSRHENFPTNMSWLLSWPRHTIQQQERDTMARHDFICFFVDRVSRRSMSQKSWHMTYKKIRGIRPMYARLLSRLVATILALRSRNTSLCRFCTRHLTTNHDRKVSVL